MLSQHTKTQSKEPIFETICRLARAKDEKALTEIVKSGVCIGVVVQGEYTPVALLAKEGNKDAVEFLINKFRALRKEAVLGFARGRHVDQVIVMLSQKSDPGKRHKLRRWAVWGFARGRHVDQVIVMLSQESDPEKLHELQKWAVWGFAQGGYVRQVKKVFSQESNPEKLHELRIWAVLGFAQGRYEIGRAHV